MVEPANTSRGVALQNLAKQLPVANSRIAQGQQASRDMQLQQAVQAAPATANVQQAAAQTGAAVATSAGADLIKSAEQSLQQQGQVVQVAQQEQQRAGQEKVTGLQAGAREQEMDSVQRLAKIDQNAKNELFDKQMTFTKDQAGRTLFNERQLADYAVSKARSNEEFAGYKQQMEVAGKRKMQAMETAYKMLEQDLNQKWQIAEQKQDQKAKQEIAYMRKVMEEKINKERINTANRNSMFGSVGMIAGGVIGGIYGGPAGAAAGASVGGAAGTMVATETNPEKA